MSTTVKNFTSDIPREVISLDNVLAYTVVDEHYFCKPMLEHNLVDVLKIIFFLIIFCLMIFNDYY